MTPVCESGPRGTVFISYSHDSADHAARVLALADALRAHGQEVSSTSISIPVRPRLAALDGAGVGRSHRIVLFDLHRDLPPSVKRRETLGEDERVAWEAT